MTTASRVEPLAEFAVDPTRLDRGGVGLHQRHLACGRCRFGVAQLGNPRRVVDPVAGVVGQRPQCQPQVARHRQHVDVAGSLRLGIDGVGDGGCSERAEPEAEVEWRAEHHHHVGALLEQAAGAQEREVVVGRQQAAAHPVEEARHTQMRRCRREFLPGAVPVDVGADQEGRTLRTGDERRERRHGVVVGSGTHPVARADVGDLTARRAEHVEREVEERRAAVRFDRQTRRLVHHRTRLRGIGDGGSQLRDRRHDRDVIEFLQRPRAPAALGRPATEHDHRRSVEVRRRDRRHAVGDARTRGQRSDARTSGQLRVRLGGERRRLLVTCVDDAHALVTRRVVERPDVATVEREHHIGAVRTQCGDRLLAGVSRDLCHVTRP